MEEYAREVTTAVVIISGSIMAIYAIMLFPYNLIKTVRINTIVRDREK